MAWTGYVDSDNLLGLASTSDEDQAASANASLGLIKPHGQRFEVAALDGRTAPDAQIARPV
jgi:hypothetical protein